MRKHVCADHDPFGHLSDMRSHWCAKVPLDHEKLRFSFFRRPLPILEQPGTHADSSDVDCPFRVWDVTLNLAYHPAFRRGGLLFSEQVWPKGPFLLFKGGKLPDQLLPGIPAGVQVL